MVHTNHESYWFIIIDRHSLGATKGRLGALAFVGAAKCVRSERQPEFRAAAIVVRDADEPAVRGHHLTGECETDA